MRTFLLLFFLTAFSQLGRAQNTTVFISATDVSAYGVCDGTLTYWVEGASVTDTFVFVLNGVLQPQVNDTIFTQTGLCAGTYTVTLALDTLSAVNYTCCNCIGVSCGGGPGGTAGSGASATIGSPDPFYVYVQTTLPECVELFSYSELSIIGGTPPYQWSTSAAGGQSGTLSGPVSNYVISGEGCGGIPTSNYDMEVMHSVTVTDASGQTITGYPFLYGQWGVDYCAANPWPGAVPNIEVCAGETISFDLTTDPFWNYNDPNFEANSNVTPLYYYLASSNSQIGLPNGQQFSVLPFPSNLNYSNTISFTAPLVSTTQVSNMTVSAGFANNCTRYDGYFTITINPAPTVNAGIDQAFCEGNATTLSGSGAISYVWDNGVSNNSMFNPLVGSTTYTVIGTDANGCQNSDQVNLTVYGLPLLDAGIDQNACNGDQVTLTANTSESPTWDNGITDGVSFLQALGTQTYTVNVTDTNGCQNTDQVVITMNALPIINAGTDQTLCDGDLATLNGSGGVSYVWDNSVSDNASFTPSLGTTTYSVIGTDANGCANTDQVDITVNGLPTVDAGIDQTICDGNQVTLSGSGATGYAWNNGISDNAAFTPTIGTTTYEVTGTDGNGCENTDQVDVSVNALPTIDAGTDQTICDGDQVTLSGSGASIYAWDNGISDNSAFTPAIGTTTYEVTGTDGNGCENTDQVDVLVNALPTIDAGTDQTICDGDQITLSGAGGTSYIWNNGVLDNTAFIPSIGITTYEVTGTDGNGCENSDQVDVTVNDLPIIDGGADVTICHGDSLLLNASGNGSIDWTGGLSNNTYFAPTNPQTELICTSTATTGCQNSDTILVNMATAINTSLTVNLADIVATPGYTNYEWQYCESDVTIQNGAQNTFTATQDGNYKVVIRNSQNCFDTSECILIDYLDLSTISKEDLINLSPNPTSGKVFVSNGDHIESIVIYDAIGRVVDRINGATNELDFSKFETGHYIVQIETSDKRQVIARILKE